MFFFFHLFSCILLVGCIGKRETNECIFAVALSEHTVINAEEAAQLLLELSIFKYRLSLIMMQLLLSLFYIFSASSSIPLFEAKNLVLEFPQVHVWCFSFVFCCSNFALQCENSHIACSLCCVKMANKCLSCLMPIGYNRCWALEKFLECAWLTCKFSSHGCNETFSYDKRQDHEMSCPCVPCCCPLSGCSFIGSSKQLTCHFSIKYTGLWHELPLQCLMPPSQSALDLTLSSVFYRRRVRMCSSS